MAQRYLPLRPPPETWGTPPSPIPLWAQRGETAVSPLWKPLLGMGERQRKEKQRVSSLQPDKCLSPRCGDALRPSANFQRSRQEAFILAAVRTGRSFVWVSWPVSGQLIPDTFSFPPCTAHFLFGVSKRKWGVHSARQSRASLRRTGAVFSKENIPLASSAETAQFHVPWQGELLTAKPYITKPSLWNPQIHGMIT